MFIIKVGYGVTPRPYPIFSRICWLFSFLVFLLTFGKCRNDTLDSGKLDLGLVSAGSYGIEP